MEEIKKDDLEKAAGGYVRPAPVPRPKCPSYQPLEGSSDGQCETCKQGPNGDQSCKE